jgi:hypothetical protein
MSTVPRAQTSRQIRACVSVGVVASADQRAAQWANNVAWLDNASNTR